MKVLFICPRFFGYEKEISDALSRQGHDVTYIDEKPSNNVFYKILLRLRKDSIYIRKSIDLYFKRMLVKAPDSVDMVIILKGESLTENIVKDIRNKYCSAKIIFYAWDSIVNYPQVQEYLHLCDEKYTFDDCDIETFPFLKHLPLFYSPAFSEAAKKRTSNKSSSNKNKISFLGSVHSDRYVLLGRFYQRYKSSFECDFILYFPSSIVLIGFVIRNIKNIIRYRLFGFSLRSRSKAEIANHFLDADAIFDIQHPGQSGLTMRTLECIPLQKKMVTTNKGITKYDFYNKTNYFILDRVTLDIDESFFDESFVAMDVTVIDRYSIDQWVNVLCK